MIYDDDDYDHDHDHDDALEAQGLQFSAHTKAYLHTMEEPWRQQKGWLGLEWTGLDWE